MSLLQTLSEKIQVVLQEVEKELNLLEENTWDKQRIMKIKDLLKKLKEPY